jgi:hypothetical protein
MLFQACTVQKRLYNKGYHISFHRALKGTNGTSLQRDTVSELNTYDANKRLETDPEETKTADSIRSFTDCTIEQSINTDSRISEISLISDSEVNQQARENATVAHNPFRPPRLRLYMNIPVDVLAIVAHVSFGLFVIGVILAILITLNPMIGFIMAFFGGTISMFSSFTGFIKLWRGDQFATDFSRTSIHVYSIFWGLVFLSIVVLVGIAFSG